MTHFMDVMHVLFSLSELKEAFLSCRFSTGAVLHFGFCTYTVHMVRVFDVFDWVSI